MLQVAFGGYYLVDGDVSEYIDSPLYYEPGFNLMSPLEIESPKADKLYILMRKRIDNSDLNFIKIKPSHIIFTAKDVTNGETLTSSVRYNTLNPAWNITDPSGNAEEVLITINNQLDMTNPLLRVRTIDCYAQDSTDNDFIAFRILVDDSGLYFHYIPINRNVIANRNTFTGAGRNAYVRMDGSSDYYVLFSPYAWLKETTKAGADFSYPQNSIYY